MLHDKDLRLRAQADRVRRRVRPAAASHSLSLSARANRAPTPCNSSVARSTPRLACLRAAPQPTPTPKSSPPPASPPAAGRQMALGARQCLNQATKLPEACMAQCRRSSRCGTSSVEEVGMYCGHLRETRSTDRLHLPTRTSIAPPALRTPPPRECSLLSVERTLLTMGPRGGARAPVASIATTGCAWLRRRGPARVVEAGPALRRGGRLAAARRVRPRGGRRNAPRPVSPPRPLRVGRRTGQTLCAWSRRSRALHGPPLPRCSARRGVSRLYTGGAHATPRCLKSRAVQKTSRCAASLCSQRLPRPISPPPIPLSSVQPLGR